MSPARADSPAPHLLLASPCDRLGCRGRRGTSANSSWGKRYRPRADVPIADRCKRLRQKHRGRDARPGEDGLAPPQVGPIKVAITRPKSMTTMNRTRNTGSQKMASPGALVPRPSSGSLTDLALSELMRLRPPPGRLGILSSLFGQPGELCHSPWQCRAQCAACRWFASPQPTCIGPTTSGGLRWGEDTLRREGCPEPG